MKNCIKTWRKNLSVEYKTFIQQSRKRFLDYYFIYLTKTNDELNIFYNILNNINKHLKFIMDFVEEKHPILRCYDREKVKTIITHV